MNPLPQWQFEQDEQGQWYWTRVTRGNWMRSAKSFPTRTECVLNAMSVVVQDRKSNSAPAQPPLSTERVAALRRAADQCLSALPDNH